jgi:hypothetical protein
MTQIDKEHVDFIIKIAGEDKRYDPVSALSTKDATR